MEGRRHRLEVPRSRVVLGRLCTGKHKLLDSCEQCSEIKCPKLVTKYQNDSKAEFTGCPSETEFDSDSAEGSLKAKDEISASSVTYSGKNSQQPMPMAG